MFVGSMGFSMLSVVRSFNLTELGSLTWEFSSGEFVEGTPWQLLLVTFRCVLDHCFSFALSAGIPSAVSAGIPSAVSAGRSKSWAKAITSRAAVSASPKPAVNAETSPPPPPPPTPTLELENVIVTIRLLVDRSYKLLNHLFFLFFSFSISTFTRLHYQIAFTYLSVFTKSYISHIINLDGLQAITCLARIGVENDSRPHIICRSSSPVMPRFFSAFIVTFPTRCKQSKWSINTTE